MSIYRVGSAEFYEAPVPEPLPYSWLSHCLESPHEHSPFGLSVALIARALYLYTSPWDWDADVNRVEGSRKGNKGAMKKGGLKWEEGDGDTEDKDLGFQGHSD